MGLDALFGDGATDEWQACADAIFPCTIEYYPAKGKVRVHIRWMDGKAQVGFCKVDLSPEKAFYKKLSFDAPGYAGVGNLTKIILNFYQWYIDHDVGLIEAYIISDLNWGAFESVGFQDGKRPRFFSHRVRSDSRLAEYIAWKKGGRKPSWRKK